MKRRNRKPRMLPYRRLEAELRFARAALSDAAAQYSRVLKALSDLLYFYDRGLHGYIFEDVAQRLAEIREIAKGKL